MGTPPNLRGLREVQLIPESALWARIATRC
jgi:hypothetical protein